MTTTTTDPNPSLKSFEEALQTLDHLVRRLEAGELSLEESLASFEQGVGLVRQLNERLAEAEQRVELLTRTAAGQLETVVADREFETRG